MSVTVGTKKTDLEIERLKAEYLSYYEKLPVQKLAAEFIGRDEDTILTWRKKDLIFADAVAKARSGWVKIHAGKVRNPEWLLERVVKEHFSPRTEITGAEGAPLFEVIRRELPTITPNQPTKELDGNNQQT